LRGMQPLLRRDCQASLFGDRDEIAKMAELHGVFHISQACRSAYKVFFFGATDAYMQPQQQWAWNQSAVSKAPPMFLLDDAPPVVAEQIARTKI
jgi:hypothetical protein